MSTETLKLGSKLPDFNLPSTDGKNYSVDSFADKKALIVIFSCNHCPYVIAYEERMKQIQEDYSLKGVAIVAINSNEDKEYPERQMVNRTKLNNSRILFIMAC